MSDIFVSYAREDRVQVEKLVRIFEEHGCTVFWDPTLLPGHQWDTRLAAELNAARCVVVAWSKNSIDSRWVREEAHQGRDKDILIPITLDGTRPPFGFGLLQSEDLSNSSGNKSDPSIVRLLDGIKSVLDGHPATQRLNASRPAAPASKSLQNKFAAVFALASIAALAALFQTLSRDHLKGSPESPTVESTNAGVQRQPAATAPEVSPRALTGSGVPSGDELDHAVAHLLEILQPANGHVSISVKGGNRVALGDDVTFQVVADRGGRLVLLDINADRTLTQIFPNKFVNQGAAAGINPGHKIAVPEPGYGFTAFKAVEPVGQGTLIALVVPSTSKIGMLPEDKERLSKGFQPVNAPVTYVQALTKQIEAELRQKYDPELKAWGLGTSDYEIVRPAQH